MDSLYSANKTTYFSLSRGGPGAWTSFKVTARHLAICIANKIRKTCFFPRQLLLFLYFADILLIRSKWSSITHQREREESISLDRSTSDSVGFSASAIAARRFLGQFVMCIKHSDSNPCSSVRMMWVGKLEDSQETGRCEGTRAASGFWWLRDTRIDMHNHEHAWVTLWGALLATFCSFSQMQSVKERKHKAQVELLQLRISPDPKKTESARPKTFPKKHWTIVYVWEKSNHDPKSHILI